MNKHIHAPLVYMMQKHCISQHGRPSLCTPFLGLCRRPSVHRSVCGWRLKQVPVPWTSVGFYTSRAMLMYLELLQLMSNIRRSTAIFFVLVLAPQLTTSSSSIPYSKHSWSNSSSAAAQTQNATMNACILCTRLRLFHRACNKCLHNVCVAQSRLTVDTPQSLKELVPVYTHDGHVCRC